MHRFEDNELKFMVNMKIVTRQTVHIFSVLKIQKTNKQPFQPKTIPHFATCDT